MGESAAQYDARSDVPCVQLLAPNGERLTDETFESSADVEAVTELFRQMVPLGQSVGSEHALPALFALDVVHMYVSPGITVVHVDERPGQFPLKGFFEITPIEKTGQRITDRLFPQLALQQADFDQLGLQAVVDIAQPLFDLLALRDIVEYDQTPIQELVLIV